MRAVTRKSGGIAFAALIVFVFVFYSNPSHLIEGFEDLGLAKIAAGIALAALAGSWLLYNRRLTLAGFRGLALIGLFAIVGFSALWSYWPGFSVDTFLDGIKYLAIFFVVANVIDTRERLQRFIAAVAIASVIPALGGIDSWRSGTHLVDGDRVGWIGVFANPNELAYHLVVGVMLMLAARQATRRRAMKVLYLVLLVPLGFTIVLTQSRGGMLACGAVLLLWLLRSVKRAPVAVGTGIALACIWMLGPSATFERRMETSVAFGEDVSARARIDAWRTGMNMAFERPLTGVGAGAFMVAWPEFAPGDAGPVHTEHNTFVQLVAELGFPALGLFVFVLLSSILGVSAAARDPELAPFARGVQCALAGFAMCSMSAGIAFSWPLYLLLGASWAISRIAAEHPAPVTSLASARLQRAAGTR
jgi:O-antigen ligase